MRTDGQKDRRDEANSRFSLLCERAYKAAADSFLSSITDVEFLKFAKYKQKHNSWLGAELFEKSLWICWIKLKVMKEWSK